ncbi:adenylate/guanylate cyclase domain-containing protein [Actinoplanes sp. N902-109]|uniref:adenylate/guanylate cyclase domain-containing protein n=1 Tax=Actinoplanes sp. (strain N902-109) TaxID=649831 RepID=UPI0003293817|nr:adenylate/guanylate cyclase domain-containing protein [Actinoplanes sp. N902-109]AGL21148.1 adenylyl cyclase class-3/4/guanylyl cyclase [Actinoplanes sp. N902-109]
MAGRTELPSGLVTFMFTDIEGSTRLARMLGDDYGSVLNAHRDVVRAALRNHSGVELFTEGDSFFVAFGSATDAVAACVASQRALAAYPWPSPEAAPLVRMGLHTGWAVPRGGEYTSTEVHRAARVASAAHGGQILCSESTTLAVTAWPAELLPAQRTPAVNRARATAIPGHLTISAAAHPARDSVAQSMRLVARSQKLVAHAQQIVALSRERPREAVRALDLVDLGLFTLRGFDDAERLFQVVAPGLQRTFPRPRTADAPVHSIPADVTPFIGRQPEVAEVRALIGTHRIVTVAGAGGSGKSRVAFAAARDVLTSYPEGVWVVDLAEGDAERALATAMGVRAEPGRAIFASVAERCRSGRMLIVLDTCDARPAEVRRLVRRLLTACPKVDVLATSRVPLAIPGECVWRIPPMCPADAYALLASRVETARGGRPGPAAEGADLARVAARLDGHPLAIELAADRLRILSATQLVSRLADPVAALDAGRRRGPDEDRHSSLTGNLDWSYNALSAPAAELLRRLAVFANPVELSTVEWSGDDAFGALSELADHSLVDVLGGFRYRMSEQVKSYAGRRLREAGEERAARERHVRWSLHILDGVAVDTDGQPRTVSLTELSPYVKEWEAALRWTVTDGSVRAGLRLACALDPWWREHGGSREGRDLLYRLYGRLPGGVSDDELASAYLMHAGLATDRDERTRFLRRAEAIARQLNDPVLLVRAKAGHHQSLIESGMADLAERQCREVIAQADRAGVPAVALPAVVALAELLCRRDALDEAAELLGGARLLEAGRPEDRGRRTVDWLLGMVALRRGDLVAAHDHLVVALRSRLRHGFRGAAADAVAAIAVRCALGDDPRTAAVLFGGSESVRGARRATQFGGYWATQQAALRRILGDTTFDAAYAEGAADGFTKAVAMALAVQHPDLEHPAARFPETVG